MNLDTYIHLWNDQCNLSNKHICHLQMFPCNLFLFLFFFFSWWCWWNSASVRWCWTEMQRQFWVKWKRMALWLFQAKGQANALKTVSPLEGAVRSLIKFKEQGVVNSWTLFWLVGGEGIRSQHHQPSAGVYRLVGSMQATSPTWWGFQYLQNSSKDMAQNIISSP